MVKPLSFKGDKKAKKRKRTEESDHLDNPDTKPAKKDNNLVRTSTTATTTTTSNSTAAADADVENDDSWVSADIVTDISGPIMLVLPTEPPSALACDANGKVFTIAIENIVEDNPGTAEPHDVRQVWVANKISGTELFRLKGHHNKYLGCDKYGIFSATSEAVTPLESFTLVATADTPGTFQVQTQRDTFLSVAPIAPGKKDAGANEVRGDVTEITFDTTLRIRMQARFKPRIKASKEEKAREKISRKELEDAVGRRLEEDEVKLLKRARREGDYHEKLLNIKIKSKHDKFG